MSKPANISITVLLVTAIGGLVALASGAVLLLSAYANFKNTSELVIESAQSFMESLEADVSQHLAPAQSVVEFLVRQAASGNLDPSVRQESVLMLSGAMAAAPQISDIAVWQPDGRRLEVSRNENRELIVETDDSGRDAAFRDYLEKLRKGGKLVWNEPFRVDRTTFISATAPLFRDGQFIGMAGAGISVGELSTLVQKLGELHDTKGFILYGKDSLLAHPRLPELPKAALSRANPLHRVAVLDNPVIEQFLNAPPDVIAKTEAFVARHIVSGNDEFVLLSRQITGFGDIPWTLGVYSPKFDWNVQFIRLWRSIISGLALFGLAILAAVILARRVASPVRDTAAASLKIGALDLDKIDYLPPSRITELNNQASAFNQMLDGLRWFETYVPRRLVRRLVRQSGKHAVESQELELTVMFTDIIGFTASCETKQPAEIADTLNEHFEMLNQCIEAEGGTLDKYIGDAVMAFWGAPEHQTDHAERACRAALAMHQALASAGHNERIKIAIHTGPLIVGNIGATARMNYTVIGDTVNTCSRIEHLAGELDDDSPAIILISDATASQLSDDFKRTRVGEFSVKGKQKSVTAYRLHADAGSTPAIQLDME